VGPGRGRSREVALATLLRFSEAAALAMHVMVFTTLDDGRPVSSRRLARLCRASHAHTVKVCQRLARAGLLSARRGADGGFVLARDPRRIRLDRIYAAIEGPVRLNGCLFRGRDCQGPRHHRCVFGSRILELEREYLRYLRGTRLSEVAATTDLRTRRR